MENIKELIKTNKLYERVIKEILEDSENYSGTKKERIIARCNDVLHGLSTGIVSSLIYYTDTTEFYNTYYNEIYELIEELENEGLEILECLKKDLTESQIIMCNDYAKNNITWFVYEEITSKLLFAIDE